MRRYANEACGVCEVYFFFQAVDGVRDAQESRGLGDGYEEQVPGWAMPAGDWRPRDRRGPISVQLINHGQSPPVSDGRPIESTEGR